MSELIVHGGRELSGSVTPVANKNTIIKLIPAALLTDDDITIHNVPMSSDVRHAIRAFELLGGSVEIFNDETSIRLNASTVSSFEIDPEISQKMKATVMFMGPLLARFGRAVMPVPEGCKLGTRPLDALIGNVVEFGVSFTREDAAYHLKTDGLRATQLRQRFPSVTGTENTILLACLTTGTTTIYNAACEPHTQELCKFLNSLGAKISGIGSNNLTIEGVQKLGGGERTCESDFLEVGGLIGAAILTNSELTIKNAATQHLGMIRQTFKKIGVHFDTDESLDQVFVPKNQELRCQKTLKWDLHEIKALHRPLFPADLIHVLVVMALKAEGSMMFTNIFYEYSFFFVQQLANMKAVAVLADPTKVVTFGPAKFQPARVVAPNIIQAAYALFLAMLATPGESRLAECDAIFRRYPRLIEQFTALGTQVELKN